MYTLTTLALAAIIVISLVVGFIIGYFVLRNKNNLQHANDIVKDIELAVEKSKKEIEDKKNEAKAEIKETAEKESFKNNL